MSGFELLTEYAGLVQGVTLWTIAGLTGLHFRRRAAR